jgi:outer membrane lipoprotein-sorting protein
MILRLLPVLVVTLFGVPAPAQTPTSAPSADRPAESVDPKVATTLDRLEAKGRDIKGVKCRVIYRYVTVEPIESAQEKQGELWFARGEPNARFCVHFQKLIADGVEKDTGEYFAFDGQWLTERNDRSKTIVRREMVRPGEHIDPFEIGKGPFPLPFGQKRAEILKNFRVTLEKFTLGDPLQSNHLHCVPLPDSALAGRFSRVEMYVDKKLELPIRIVTERLSDGNRIEVDFKNIDTNEAPAGSRFVIEQPKDFEVTVEPLKADQKTGDVTESGK